MSHASRQPARYNRRTTFISGRIRPQRQPKPCAHSHHAGPFVRRPDLDARAEETFAGFGVPARFAHYECRTCGVSISLCHNPREVA
jgi:hypothetical protein